MGGVKKSLLPRPKKSKGNNEAAELLGTDVEERPDAVVSCARRSNENVKD